MACSIFYVVLNDILCFKKCSQNYNRVKKTRVEQYKPQDNCERNDEKSCKLRIYTQTESRKSILEIIEAISIYKLTIFFGSRLESVESKNICTKGVLRWSEVGFQY